MNIPSAQQKQILWDGNNNPINSGKIKIFARPGTGKTFTVTNYCIDLMRSWGESHNSWEGLAVLSYTNVAKDEIINRIKHTSDGSELLHYPHYVGTLDSFINKYIFLPFSYRVVNYSNRPKMIGEPFAYSKTMNSTLKSSMGGIAYLDAEYYSYKCSFNAEGELFFIGGEIKTKENGSIDIYDNFWKITLKSWKKVDGTYGAQSSKINQLKLKKIENGEFTQSDANYFALRILKENEDIRKLVTKKFKHIIIDEAQDMTEIQHAILDILNSVENGIDASILVGDDVQAIYEWNTARPDIFQNKIGYISKGLSDTFRCSKNICDVLNKLDDKYPLVPIGKNKEYQDAVKFVDWNNKSNGVTASYISEFIDLVGKKKPHDEKSGLRLVVLTRSKELSYQLFCEYTGLSSDEKSIDQIKFEDKTTWDFFKVLLYLQSPNPDPYLAIKAYHKYWQSKYSIENIEQVMEMISKQIFHYDFEDLDEYKMSIFHKMKELRNITYKVSNISEVAELPDSMMNSIFPEFESHRKDAANFMQIHGCDLEIAKLFDKDNFMQALTVKSSSDIDVSVLFATIHGVKGETYDGVAYFSKKGTGLCTDCIPNGNGKRASAWVDILGHDIYKCESKRLVYVALSRAAQKLWIVAPQIVCQKLEVS